VYPTIFATVYSNISKCNIRTKRKLCKCTVYVYTTGHVCTNGTHGVLVAGDFGLVRRLKPSNRLQWGATSLVHILLPIIAQELLTVILEYLTFLLEYISPTVANIGPASAGSIGPTLTPVL